MFWTVALGYTDCRWCVDTRASSGASTGLDRGEFRTSVATPTLDIPTKTGLRDQQSSLSTQPYS